MRAALSVVLFLFLAVSARAGEVFILGPNTALELPLSPRSLGMGGAGAALGFGDALDTWTNPALVGVERGVRWEWSSYDPYAGTSGVARWGGSRLGVNVAGLGLEFGTPRLDPGDRAALFGSGGDERVRTWIAGASLGRLVDALSGRADGADRLTRWGDVALGLGRRKLEGASVGLGSGRANVRDWGLYARVTPFHDQRGERHPPGSRVDVAYAHAVQNDSHTPLAYDAGLAIISLPRVVRDGIAVRYACRRDRGEGLEGSFAALLNAGLDPALTLGLAWDVQRSNGGEAQNYGAEIGVLRMLTLRVGYVDDPTQSRSGGTIGGGIAIPVGPAFVARWDASSEPIAKAFGEQAHRSSNAITVRFDPGAWWSSRDEQPGGK